MKKDRTSAFRPRIEQLEDRRMLALSVQFDYSRDTGRVFASDEARSAFEETVTSITSRLNDSLLPITTSGANRATAFYTDPGGVGTQLTIPNFSIPANTIKIFAGSRNTGARVGFAGPGGISATSPSQNYIDRAVDRGQIGVRSATDVGLWGGSVSLNSTTNWYFGQSAADVGSNQVDFRTVVAHEIFHLLGFGIEITPGTSSWEHLARNETSFLGAKARAANGGSYPAIDEHGGHWTNNTTSDGVPALMIGIYDLNTPGVRIVPTALDWAALDDLGWEISGGPAAPTVIDVDATTGQSETSTEVTVAFADINLTDRHSAAIRWGDGTALTQLSSVTSPFTATHTYGSSGTYTATVWVTDSTDRSGIETFTLNIGNGDTVVTGKPAPPVLVAPGDRTSLAGGTSRIQFSFADANATDTHAAAVDWGDGTPLVQLDSVNRTFSASHAYEKAGVYRPIVWVTDSSRLSDREQFSMTVYASGDSGPPTPINIAAPIITPPGNRTAIVGAEAKLTFHFTDANTGDRHAAAIDWGDGSALTQLETVRSPFTVSHRYERTGVFKPKLWVTDATLRSDREEFTMTIYPSEPKGIPDRPSLRRAPFVVNPGLRTATAGFEITVTIGFSDPNRSDTHSAAINWGDGSPLTQLSSVTSPFIVRHTYTQPGNYEPQVWVTDQHRLSDSQKFPMMVSSLPSRATFAHVDSVFAMQDDDEE